MGRESASSLVVPHQYQQNRWQHGERADGDDVEEEEEEFELKCVVEGRIDLSPAKLVLTVARGGHCTAIRTVFEADAELPTEGDEEEAAATATGTFGSENCRQLQRHQLQKQVQQRQLLQGSDAERRRMHAVVVVAGDPMPALGVRMVAENGAMLTCTPASLSMRLLGTIICS
jgi:hypothetical protein